MEMMNEHLIEHMRREFEGKTSDELSSIYVRHNTFEWPPEGFEVIRRIFDARGEQLPAVATHQEDLAWEEKPTSDEVHQATGQMSSQPPQLRKVAKILGACLAFYTIGVLAFLISSRPPDTPLSEAVIFYPVGLLLLPFAGFTLTGWGFQLLSMEHGALEGFIPAPIVGLAAVPGGLALACAFPLTVFGGAESLSALILFRGGLSSSLVLLAPLCLFCAVVVSGDSDSAEEKTWLRRRVRQWLLAL